MRQCWIGGWLLLSCLVTTVGGEERPPRVLDERLELTLFAEHPHLATPTGIDVDAHGRVWVVESNTHFRPKDYAGHPSDRVLVFRDADGDGRAEAPVMFLDGLTHAMSVAVKPEWLDPPTFGPGTKPISPTALCVFIATRAEVLLAIDHDGDLQADQRITLVKLDTPGDYPHNGLAGFAIDALGYLYFGFGENLGANYQIRGSDGKTLSGGGEGGNVYRCRANGSKLERFATGFWNPHASCMDAYGRLFSVDNDPDSRPPCRLLHVVRGGDYGYRFRNGRRGTHPFTAWNGELPGTLPMVCGTGEGPSGIVAYESDGFPEDYQGNLLVGSWGDHRIDRFVLQRRGASVTSLAEAIVKGGSEFRPVGLAVAPDGSLYFSDWVKPDYNLHGAGRVWRLRGKSASKKPPLDLATITADRPANELMDLLQHRRIEVRRLAAKHLTQQRLAASKGPERLQGAFLPASTEPPSRGAIELAWGAAAAALGSGPSPTVKNVDELQVAGEAWRGAAARLLQASTFPFGELRARLTALSPGATAEPLSLRDPFVTYLVVRELEEQSSPASELALWEAAVGAGQIDPEWQLALLVSLRHHVEAAPTAVGRGAVLKVLEQGLTAADRRVRRTAIQWIGEGGFNELAEKVTEQLDAKDSTPELFLASLATLSLLEGTAPSVFEQTPPAERLVKWLQEKPRSPGFRVQALRLIPANVSGLDPQALFAWTREGDTALRTEAIRSLALINAPAAQEGQLAIAMDPQIPAALRAEAVTGLARSNPQQPLPEPVWKALNQLVGGDQKVPAADRVTLQREALRALRGRAEEPPVRDLLARLTARAKELDRAVVAEVAFVSQKEPRAPFTAAELVTLGQSSKPTDDPEAGRRLFYHPHGPLCARCHTVQGRGGKVGPDLTVIAQTMNRQKLIESITEPSREISPQYTTWIVETKSGKVHTGIVVTERGGDQTLGNERGETIDIPAVDVEDKTISKKSIMPDNLVNLMTTQDFRDLLAFLETLK